jgi:hypothetical protein
VTKESLFELEAYCGLLWSEAKTMLDAEGAIIAEEVLLTPPTQLNLSENNASCF